MFVYVIVNHETLKIYVGKTTTFDLHKYLRKKIWDAQKGRWNGRSHLFASMQKHASTVWNIYPLFKGQTNEEICEHEKLLIKALGVRHPEIGYNICRGGEGHTGPISDEVKAKWRDGNQKYWDKHRQNLMGQTFGRLSVQSETERGKGGKRRWNCLCACGNRSIVATHALKSGAIKSCGCLIREAGKRRWAKQGLVGKVFSRLTVQAEAGRNKNKQRLWNCLCSCGNTAIVRTAHLKNGAVQSCGCLSRELAKRKKTPEQMKNCREAHKSPARQAAISERKPFYFTGKPCKRGHITRRRTKDGSCGGCEKEKSTNRRTDGSGISISTS